MMLKKNNDADLAEQKHSVSPMDWVQECNGDFTSKTVVGEYHIGMPNIYWALIMPSGEVVSGFDTYQKAQDAARSDYELKIISASLHKSKMGRGRPSTGFNKAAYMKEYMRKKRAEKKRNSVTNSNDGE